MAAAAPGSSEADADELVRDSGAGGDGVGGRAQAQGEMELEEGRRGREEGSRRRALRGREEEGSRGVRGRE